MRLEEIDPIYHEKAYYLEPDEAGGKPFALLMRALEEKGLVAVAQVAIRNKERLCALRPGDGRILLHTLFYPDEIRSTRLEPFEAAAVSDDELKMALTLVEMLEKPFEPDEYHDEYHDALMIVINAKLEGQEIVEAAEPETAKVVDLMAALKASVEAASQQHEADEAEARRRGHRRRRRAQQAAPLPRGGRRRLAPAPAVGPAMPPRKRSPEPPEPARPSKARSAAKPAGARQRSKGKAPAPGDLSTYEAKRDFTRTPEPPPHPPPTEAGPLTFVVQQHRATRMHYDVRLEVDGAMPSWPVPRGPSTNPRDKRLAIQTEPHPLDYASFEGVIPKGEYGGGEVIVWDNGTYSPDEALPGEASSDGGASGDGSSGGRPSERHRATSFGDRAQAEARVRAGIAAGKLSVTFRGRKLKGSWTFVKTKASEDSWLLIKHQDEAADRDRELVAGDASVISGLTIADLQSGRLPDPTRAGTPPRLADLPGVALGEPPAGLKPMQATLATGPFDDPRWLFEPKLDGVRALVTVVGGVATLRSRRGLDITAQYPALARALARQPAATLVLDGEIVALGERGVPSFERLQQRMGLQNPDEIATADAELPVLFFAFDIVHLDGYDLRRVPLEHRVEVRARVLLPGPLVQPVQTFAADGVAAFEAAAALGLEGVVAKRRDSPYEDGKRSRRWLKVKARRTDEFVVGGHHSGEGTRSGTFGALLLGTRDEADATSDALRYVGRVGTGFDEATLRALRARLDALETDANPFGEEPPDCERVTFVRPELVAEVAYANATRDGILRAPSFVRLRPTRPRPRCAARARSPRRRELSPQMGGPRSRVRTSAPSRERYPSPSPYPRCSSSSTATSRSYSSRSARTNSASRTSTR